MPCRRPGAERFLLLEHAVSLPGGAVGASSGSKEVDALVAKLGEVLQLSAQRRAPPAPRLPPKRQGRDRAAPYSSPRGLGFLASLHHRHPPPHALSPASLLLLPPSPPSAADREGSPRVAKQLCGRGWLRSAGKKHSRLSAGDEDDEDEDDDPHRLLQELILSGNLIKEAVRRLQLAATTPSTAEASSATASPGSASSSGSCCCHSSSGEGDSAAASAYGVSALQARP